MPCSEVGEYYWACEAEAEERRKKRAAALEPPAEDVIEDDHDVALVEHAEIQVAQLAEHWRASGVTEALQAMKIGEEAGEAIAAYVGMVGGNPRKGVTHSTDEFFTELADCAVTALVTIAFFGGDPGDLLAWRLDQVIGRIERRPDRPSRALQHVNRPPITGGTAIEDDPRYCEGCGAV